MAINPKWSWDKWTEAVQACNLLGGIDRDLATRFRKAFKRRGQWIGPWEIKGAPGYGDLVALELAGFAYMKEGFYVPLLDPLPEPNSVLIGPGESRLLRRMLSGKQLYHVTEPSGVKKWKLYSDLTYKYEPVDEAYAATLKKIWLIEPDGCTGHDGKSYCPNRRRLAGVKGFRQSSMAYILHIIERSRAHLRTHGGKPC